MDSSVELSALAVPNPLTGETFDNVPVHKRKLGELWILFRPHQPSHYHVCDLGLISAISLIFNRMIGTGSDSIFFRS